MIHVIDDSKNEKRDFNFSRSLLVKYMKYLFSDNSFKLKFVIAIIIVIDNIYIHWFACFSGCQITVAEGTNRPGILDKVTEAAPGLPGFINATSFFGCQSANIVIAAAMHYANVMIATATGIGPFIVSWPRFIKKAGFIVVVQIPGMTELMRDGAVCPTGGSLSA